MSFMKSLGSTPFVASRLASKMLALTPWAIPAYLGMVWMVVPAVEPETATMLWTFGLVRPPPKEDE